MLTQLSNFDNLPVRDALVFLAYFMVAGCILLRFKKLHADGGNLALFATESLSHFLEVLLAVSLELRPERLPPLFFICLLPGTFSWLNSTATNEARAY